jgi:hypothetical protein
MHWHHARRIGGDIDTVRQASRRQERDPDATPSGTPTRLWSKSMLHAALRSASTCSGPDLVQGKHVRRDGIDDPSQGRDLASQGRPRGPRGTGSGCSRSSPSDPPWRLLLADRTIRSATRPRVGPRSGLLGPSDPRAAEPAASDAPRCAIRRFRGTRAATKCWAFWRTLVVITRQTPRSHCVAV